MHQFPARQYQLKKEPQKNHAHSFIIKHTFPCYLSLKRKFASLFKLPSLSFLAHIFPNPPHPFNFLRCYFLSFSPSFYFFYYLIIILFVIIYYFTLVCSFISFTFCPLSSFLNSLHYLFRTLSLSFSLRITLLLFYRLKNTLFVPLILSFLYHTHTFLVEVFIMIYLLLILPFTSFPFISLFTRRVDSLSRTDRNREE